jgi:hypothetical protein
VTSASHRDSWAANRERRTPRSVVHPSVGELDQVGHLAPEQVGRVPRDADVGPALLARRAGLGPDAHQRGEGHRPQLRALQRRRVEHAFGDAGLHPRVERAGQRLAREVVEVAVEPPAAPESGRQVHRVPVRVGAGLGTVVGSDGGECDLAPGVEHPAGLLDG